MAKFEIEASDEYINQLKNLENEKVLYIIEKSIYEGANIVANQIKNELESLNTETVVTPTEKKDMIEGFGISPMQFTNGEHNVKIGFDGYGSKPTKKYPKGVPIPLTARSVISGTSFRKKNDFVRRGVNKSKKKAIKKMDEVINEEIKKEMNK